MLANIGYAAACDNAACMDHLVQVDLGGPHKSVSSSEYRSAPGSAFTTRAVFDVNGGSGRK